MRVLVLANAASPHTARWSAGLVERGVEVHVASIRRAEIPGATVHRFGVGAGSSVVTTLLSYVRLLFAVRALAARIDPDVVHAHYSVTHGAIAVLARLRPVVLTVWGTDVARGDRIAGGPKRWLNRWVLRRVGAITAAGGFLVSSATAVAGLSTPVHRIPFGVDTRRFRPAAGSREGFTIGFTKHLHPRYDPETLVEAFAQVAGTLGEARLVMAGAGPMLDRLTQRAASLGVADRVEFLGALPHDAIPELMREFDVLVNPSRSESFGVALLEASATGIPVIATRVGGVGETVLDGRTGILVEPGDVAGIADALLTLAADAPARRRMGAAGREHVVRHFEWDDCVDRMLGVLAGAR